MIVKSTRPYFPQEDIRRIITEINDVLSSGRLILGKYNERFEKEFAKYTGVKHAIAVNTCTSALTTALSFFGVKDKEVIVPSATMIATPNSVLHARGKVVFADIKKETMSLDCSDIKKKITKKTKTIIIVHLLGYIGHDLDEIRNICKERNIALIEDAAHAHGADIQGKKSGSLGNAGCFSFYPTKIMTSTTGGMITTNNDELNDFARSMRFFGSGKDLNQIVRPGNDWLFGEINAILGFYQLKRLDYFVKKRNIIATKYDQALGNIKNIQLFPVPKNSICSYYKYPVLLPQKTNLNNLIKKIKMKYGIETSLVYIPCHLQPFYKEMFGFKEGLLPVTEDMMGRVICLPIHFGLTDKEQEHVIKSFKKEI